MEMSIKRVYELTNNLMRYEQTTQFDEEKSKFAQYFQDFSEGDFKDLMQRLAKDYDRLIIDYGSLSTCDIVADNLKDKININDKAAEYVGALQEEKIKQGLGIEA